MHSKRAGLIFGVLLITLILSGCTQNQVNTLVPLETTISLLETTATANFTAAESPFSVMTKTPTIFITPSQTITKSPVPSLPPGIVNEVHIDY